MKRVYFFIFLFIVLLNAVQSSNITGEAITGEATTQQINMDIFVQLTLPYVLINSPKNETYLKNTSILLNYTVSNYDFIWYNLDGSENITITGPLYLNVSQGNHALNLYANNTVGLKRALVNFIANSSKLIIFYEEFKGSTKGESFDFYDYTYEEVQNLENVILENTKYGKIEFSEFINVIQGISGDENIVDLDSNIEISRNNIFLNSEEIPGLNKSASLSLYGIGFINPRILKNGVICSFPVCSIESYSGGTLRFNVSSFTTYSSEEAPEVPGSGSETGGIDYPDIEVIPVPEVFNISTDRIIVKLRQGEKKEEILEIWNLGTEKASFMITPVRTENFLKISNKTFELNPKKKIDIVLDFLAEEDLAPDLYFGKLIIETLTHEKEILIAMEVESKKVLFDIKAEIKKGFRVIKSGENVVAKIELFNLGEDNRTEVLMEYVIKDKNGDEILKEQEILVVETKADFLKEFQLPPDLSAGDYSIYVRVIYGNEVASSSAWFAVKERKGIPWVKISLYLLLFLVLFAIFKLYKLYLKAERAERVRRYEEDEEREKKIKQIDKKKTMKKLIGKKMKGKRELKKLWKGV